MNVLVAEPVEGRQAWSYAAQGSAAVQAAQGSAAVQAAQGSEKVLMLV
jgi:hypothetical protein